MKKIGIVILNFNGKKDTVECLKSLEKISYRGISVVVVDNGSTDGSLELIENEFPKMSVIKNKINLGFSGGNNVGIGCLLKKEVDFVIILNNDTLVDKEFVNELLASFDKDEKTGIVSPKIYFEKGFEFHKNRYQNDEFGQVIWYAGGIMDWNNVIGSHRGVDEVDNGQYDRNQSTDFATGCCMMVKKDVFEKLGLLDEKYFLYYEDADLCERAKKSGFKIFYAPKAIVWHKNAGSAGGSGSSIQDYYITRNRLLFGIRYAPFRSKISLLNESFKILFKGRRSQKKGVLDFYFRKFGKENNL